jgi:hypothetical protein
MVSMSTLVLMRRYAVSVLLAITTLLALFTAWPVRDQELVVRFQQAAESDVGYGAYNEKLFCAQLPECFRVANKVVVSTAQIATDGLVEAFRLLPGSSVTEIPEQVPQYTRNLAPHLLLRIMVIVGLAFALRVYLKRWWVVGVVANLLLFWSTGVPVRAVTHGYEWLLGLIGRTDFYPGLAWHVARNSTIFLLDYDYVALVTVVFLPVLLSRATFQQGIVRPLLLGAALALTFENLAAVFIIGLLWSSWRITKRVSLVKPFLIGLGWLVPIVSLIVFSKLSNPDAGTPLVAITKLGYSINSEYRPLVLRLLIGFLVLPYLLGMLTEFVLSRLGVKIEWSHQLRIYINGIILGLCFSFLVGYFHSALATEFGRQSISAQVLLFLSGFLARQARSDRRANKEPKSVETSDASGR